MKRIFIVFLILLSCFAARAQSKDPRVWYEIFVGSFYDSDGDGMGDLNGVAAKLDYIHDLGADGIWLMPINPGPSYHKYDVTDYRAVAPEYGTISDFENLCAEAHKRGMKVMLDLVLNHSSSLHPWFLSACESQLIEPCGQAVCAREELCRNHNPLCGFYNFTTSAGAGYSFIRGSSVWLYESRFGSHMPDFNLDSPALRAEILDICRHWISLGADAFRLDAVFYYYTGSTEKDIDFLNWLCSSLREIKPDFYVVGEAWADGANLLKLYESSIDSLFNFPFGNATGSIISAVKGGRGRSLSTVLETWYSKLPTGRIDAVFLTNHDMARSASALIKPEREKLAANIYMLLPGSPFIYYGEEIGMKGGSKSDPDKRTQFWWSYTDLKGMCNAPKEASDIRKIDKAADEQLKDKNSLLKHYMALGNIRRKYSAFFGGSFSSVTSDIASADNKGICAYTLTKDGKSITVIHNLGSADTELRVDGGLKICDTLLCLEDSTRAEAAGDEVKLKNGVLRCPAMCTVILK
ncbi:MAG: alpha-amylase family glycosyl hydrolase [Spirochaetales bacterium]